MLKGLLKKMIMNEIGCRLSPARRRFTAWSLSAGLGVLAFAAPALAAEETSPFRGEMKFELHNDWTKKSDDPANKRNDANAKIETTLEAAVAKSVKIKSLLTLEPVRDPVAGKDRFFEDEGLYAQELFAEYDGGNFALRGGKFGQKFGIAWDVAPGIWGTDFAEDYELAEQIGVAADLRMAVENGGEHTLSVGTFFADTTFFSQSVITGRGHARKADGGAGNTEDFSSFTVALDGEKVPALGGLRYHLAYLHRGADAAGEKSEKGLVGAVSVKIPADKVVFVPLVEYAAFQDRSGTSGKDAHYLTTSLGMEIDAWNAALSRTARTNQESGAAAVDDSLYQISGGYTFANGIGVHLGWRKTQESGVDSDTLGLLVEYAIKL